MKVDFRGQVEKGVIQKLHIVPLNTVRVWRTGQHTPNKYSKGSLRGGEGKGRGYVTRFPFVVTGSPDINPLLTVKFAS